MRIHPMYFTTKSFNPISDGIRNGYLNPGVGGALRAPPMFLMKERPETNFFFTLSVISLFIPRIQKISLLTSKLWILESKIDLILESEISIFAENRAEIQRNCLIAILKWPPKIIMGMYSRAVWKIQNSS